MCDDVNLGVCEAISVCFRHYVILNQSDLFLFLKQVVVDESPIRVNVHKLY